MKFTIDEAFENIKARFSTTDGKTGLKLSERTVKETLEPLMEFATDETELADFCDKAFKGINSTNVNFIKEQSDFVKNYKPDQKKPDERTPDVKPEGEHLTATQIAEIAAKAASEAVKTAVSPLQDEINANKTEKTLAQRSAEVAGKVKELKLSKAWGVDFESAIEIAELKLGSKATAEEVFNHAKSRFDGTLSQRGETYKPQSSDDADVKKFDSKAEIERLKKEGRWKGGDKED